ncbi:MAG TPA: hypothetical protein VGK19_21345 [Capsulimonadaceae bacterium]|jgi:hypothetical protein
MSTTNRLLALIVFVACALPMSCLGNPTKAPAANTTKSELFRVHATAATIAFSPDGTKLAFGRNEQQTRGNDVFDISVFDIARHRRTFYGIDTFGSDGRTAWIDSRRLISATTTPDGDPGSLVIWNTRSRQKQTVRGSMPAGPWSVSVVGSTALSAGYSPDTGASVLYVINTTTGELIKTRKLIGQANTAVFPDAKAIVLSEGRRVRVLAWPSMTELRRVTLHDDVVCVTIARKARSIFVLAGHRIYSLRSGDLSVVGPPTLVEESITDTLESPDGKSLFGISAAGTRGIVLWVDTKGRLGGLRAISGAVPRAYSHDGKRVAEATRSGDIVVRPITNLGN